MDCNKNISECALADCQVLSKLNCSGCKLVHYCTEGHQKLDWKNHKKVCSPLTLQTSTELGRHFVASRNLKAGTLLVSELPLLVEPLFLNLGDEFKNNLQMQMLMKSVGLDQSVCLACCRPAEGKKCPKCEWPICSSECSKAKIHAENECPIFSRNSLKIKKIDQEILTGVFFVRAILFKKAQPKLWDKIQDLQFESSNKTAAQKRTEEEAFLFMDQGFRSNFKKLEKDLGEDFFNLSDLAKLYGIQKLNAFALSFDHEEKPDKKTTARILYQKASMFSHACFPNCSWGVSCGPVFKMEIRTAVDIAKGQILSISYSLTDFLIGSVKRNMNEIKRGNFNCFCARCVDPTELNSMISAVKCQNDNCPDGYLLPKDPKNFSPSSIWACNKCGDQSTKTWENIEILVKRAEKMTKKFGVFQPQKIDELLIILRKHLHPNHWTIQEFCRTVMSELVEIFTSENSGDDKEGVLDYYIKITKYMVQVSQLSMPGLNYYKSIVQHRLFKGLKAKFERMERIDQRSLDLAKEILEILDELLKVKRLEPNCRTNDGQWNPIMLDLMENKRIFEIFLISN